MIKNFLIINCIGNNDKIGLKVENNFYIHDLDYKINNNDQLVISILNLIKKHKVNFDSSFSVLVNNGPGSFSSIRISLAAAKGITYAEQVRDQQTSDVVSGILAASGLPTGITYSGPGAGPDGTFDPSVIYNITAIADAQEEEDTSEQDTIDITTAVTAAIDALDKPEDNETVIEANNSLADAVAEAKQIADDFVAFAEKTKASVESAENYAEYTRKRFGPFHYQYRNAKKRADAAKLDAQNKVNQERTKASVAQAKVEDARKAAAGALIDAEDD